MVTKLERAYDNIEKKEVEVIDKAEDKVGFFFKKKINKIKKKYGKHK